MGCSQSEKETQLRYVFRIVIYQNNYLQNYDTHDSKNNQITGTNTTIFCYVDFFKYRYYRNQEMIIRQFCYKISSLSSLCVAKSVISFS